MKRFNKQINAILIAAILLIAATEKTFANPGEKVNGRVMRAFQKEFSFARQASWESSRELYKVTFRLNEQVMVAYYNTNGNLLAITRNIPSTQLPLNLLKDLKKNYTPYWITGLYELSAGTDSTYYLTLEDADQRIVLSSQGTAGWKFFKKEDK